MYPVTDSNTDTMTDTDIVQTSMVLYKGDFGIDVLLGTLVG